MAVLRDALQDAAEIIVEIQRNVLILLDKHADARNFAADRARTEIHLRRDLLNLPPHLLAQLRRILQRLADRGRRNIRNPAECVYCRFHARLSEK